MPTSPPPERRLLHPTPGVAVQQFILKVHSRCDLACDHCYVYENVDQSWLSRTKMMTPATVRAAAERIAEHAAAHRLDHVDVILHGGEPLLLGPQGIRSTVQLLHEVLTPPLQLTVHLQTNGVQLDAQMCETLADGDVKVGVSLDGDRQANDRHRRFANGASSYDQVRRALALLRRPSYRSIYAGLLCTIDIANDPIRVYEALLREEPPRVDFLLPHATWEHPPPQVDDRTTPYADWLQSIHERWTRDGEPMPVRLFDSLLSVAEGGLSSTEAVGPSRPAIAVIETDGEWEQIDSLKVTYHAAAATGMNVHEHGVDEVAASVGLLNHQQGSADLCRTCRECPLVERCGGGLFAHRYRPDNGFDNPSVYCADLKRIVALVRPRPRPDPVDPTPTAATPTAAQGAAAQGAAAQGAAAQTVPGSVIDDLAAGRLGTGSLNHLIAYQQAVDRALFELLAPLLAQRAAPGWDLLSRLLIEAPAAAQAVISHPYARVWARECHQALHTPGKAPDLGYLATLAGSAAIRAGRPAEIIVPVAEGRVHLPGLGTITVEPDAGSAVLTSTTDGDFTVQTGRTHEINSHEIESHQNDSRDAAWRPLKTIHRQGISLMIDDSDPYRDCHGSPVTQPLSDAAADAWAEAVGTAWSQTMGPDDTGWGTVITAVTPLRRTPHCRPDPAACDRTLAVAGLPLSADPALLGRWLRQQAAHLQVNLLLDLTRPTDPAGSFEYQPRVTLPWTARPRGLGRCLREVAGRIAVHEQNEQHEQHEQQADREHQDLLAALTALDRQVRWSPDGQRFLSGLRRRVDPSQTSAVGAGAT